MTLTINTTINSFLGRLSPRMFGVWATPNTILKLPNQGEIKMTYEEQARAWIRSSPFVKINIGRFTLKFKFKADQDWDWVWDLTEPDNFEDTPEDTYFYKTILRDLAANRHDMDFIDVLLKELQEKPFNQGEAK